MAPTVTETTNPATSEFGMRTFEVKLNPDQIIEVALAQRVREACPGEILNTDELLISNQVARNEDLYRAVLLMGDLLCTAPAKALSL